MATKDDHKEEQHLEQSSDTRCSCSQTSRSISCALSGLLLIAIAGSVISIQRAVVRREVKATVRMDSRSKFESYVEQPDEDYDVYIWNITNLDDVLALGEKPRLEEIKFPMKEKEINFDLQFLDDHDQFEYKSWWTYVPKNDEVAAAMNESNIVQLNPVYLASVAELGGTEQAMFVALSHLALQGVVSILQGVVDQAKPLFEQAYATETGMENVDLDSADYVRYATGTNLTSWDEVVAAQFGQGLLTRRYFGLDSVLPIVGDDIVLVAPELFGAFGEVMSTDDAVAFLANFSQPNSFYNASVEDKLRYPGVTMSNLPVIMDYLYSYITETMFLKGFVVGYYRLEGTHVSDPRGESSLYLVDGLGKHNSGMFTKRSANEMLFGYHDRIFDLLPQNFSTQALVYGGILGPSFEGPEEQVAANSPLIYREWTGKKNYKKTRQYTMWRNTTFILDRDEYPTPTGSSFSCDTWEAQGYESCKIWLEPIEFTDVAKDQVEALNPRKNYRVWVPEVLRVIDITYERDTHVRGVRGRKYVVKESSLVTADCDAEPNSCNPENAVYRMQGPSYHAPMYTARAGAPNSVTRPALGQMDQRYRDLFEGLPDYDQAKHEAYITIEPITGFFIEGKLRLQNSWDLTSEQHSSWPALFVRSDVLYFPYLWFDKNDKISRSSARSFKKTVYVYRALALALAVIFACIGVCLLIAAAVLFVRNARNSAEPHPEFELVRASPTNDGSVAVEAQGYRK